MAKVAKRRGRYVLDYYDHQGKRRRKTLKKGTTLKEAKEKLREIEDQIARGLYVPDKRVPTFKETAEQWLEDKMPNLRASTWCVYGGHTKHHFSEFDNIKINRITTAKIEKWITDRQMQGMKVATLKRIIGSMGQIFKYAARHGYIAYNPFLDAERPRENQTEGQGHKIRVLNADEIKKLWDSVKPQKYKTLFKLAIMSGMRQGELLGLKWSDVDWENSQIHVQRTYNYQAWYKPKTKNSNRKIDLGPSMVADLKLWRVACPPNKLDLIFPSRSEGPMDHNLVYYYFKPALVKAGLGKFRFHDLRHTFASLLIEQGENIKYIQSQLGHSTPTVTLNVYAHLMKPVNQEAARRLEDTIFGSGHKTVTNDNKTDFIKSDN